MRGVIIINNIICSVTCSCYSYNNNFNPLILLLYRCRNVNFNTIINYYNLYGVV